MRGAGARRGRENRRGHPAMAWTIAVLALAAAAFATNARPPTSQGAANEWIRTAPVPVNVTTPPTTVDASGSTVAGAGGDPGPTVGGPVVTVLAPDVTAGASIATAAPPT